MSERQALSAVERLRSAVLARTRAEIDEALAIAELAEQHEWPADAEFDVIGTRPVRIGADGTALIDEFLPLEVAALKGISVAAATWLIRGRGEPEGAPSVALAAGDQGSDPDVPGLPTRRRGGPFRPHPLPRQGSWTPPWPRRCQPSRGVACSNSPAAWSPNSPRKRSNVCSSAPEGPVSSASCQPTIRRSPTFPPGWTPPTQSSSTPWSTGSPTSSRRAATMIPRTSGGRSPSASSPRRHAPRSCWPRPAERRASSRRTTRDCCRRRSSMCTSLRRPCCTGPARRGWKASVRSPRPCCATCWATRGSGSPRWCGPTLTWRSTPTRSPTACASRCCSGTGSRCSRSRRAPPGPRTSTTPTRTDRADPGRRGPPTSGRFPGQRTAARPTAAGGFVRKLPTGVFWWESPAGLQYRVGPEGTSRMGFSDGQREFNRIRREADEGGPPDP